MVTDERLISLIETLQRGWIRAYYCDGSAYQAPLEDDHKALYLDEIALALAERGGSFRWDRRVWTLTEGRLIGTLPT